jgi:hypothetical protein
MDKWMGIHRLIDEKKGEAIPVTGQGGPQGCETSRLAHFLDSWLTDGGEVGSFTCQPPFIPRKIPGTHFCYGLSRPQGHVRLEGLGGCEISSLNLREC